MRNYEQGPNRKNADGGRLTKVSGALLVRRFSVREPEMYRVIEKVLAQKLTLIDKAALCELAQTVMDLELDGIEGDFIHVGDEGVATVIEHAKRRHRTFCVHGPHETPTESGPCAFAHIDCGEYGLMRVLLEHLAPRLVAGAHLIVDHYQNREECRHAVDDYFRGKGGFQLFRKSRLHVIRTCQ